MITGALTGIGRAAAMAFADEGYRLVVSGRHEDAGQALVAELRALGAEAEFIYADVRQDEDVLLIASVGLTPPSTTLALKATPARLPSSPLTATPRPLIPMCSARSSA
jgi:NAD(P)-dependent dehydrogenase (short-subunit alcohol dehydrogenase family)